MITAKGVFYRWLGTYVPSVAILAFFAYLVGGLPYPGRGLAALALSSLLVAVWVEWLRSRR
jgi:hypothetical protein